MLVDSGDAQGPLVVFESAQQAAAVGLTLGDVSVHVGPSEEIPESPLSATITFPSGPAGEAVPFFIVPGGGSTGSGPSSAAEAAARLRNEPVRHLHGRVLGGQTGVDVWGVGPEGRPVLHVKPRPDGTFDAVAPDIDIGFYATMAHTRASPIVSRAVRDDSELELTMLPGGEAHVLVEDPDTGQVLTARLIVHGVAPTADPNFGPDYRASGAGPLMDATARPPTAWRRGRRHRRGAGGRRRQRSPPRAIQRSALAPGAASRRRHARMGGVRPSRPRASELRLARSTRRSRHLAHRGGH